MFLTKRTNQNIVCTLAAILILVLLCPSVRANENKKEIVKVGYYENEVFEEGAEEGAVKTGYAYEYYRKISEYTGWKYEYVYGSFSDLYDMLLRGDIDLLAGLAKTEERQGIIGYPETAMGNEIYTLIKHDSDTMVSSEPSTLNGKKIGVLNSAIATVLRKYLDEHNVNAEIIEFDDYETLFTAFDEKKVDILAAEGDGAYGREHSELTCTFGISDYYLCVNKKAPDILAELNNAQSQLAAEEPNYLSSLRSKYYSSSVSSLSFSSDEREWIGSHNFLTVGYLDNYLPYSDTDMEGNVTGIVKDITSEMLNKLDIAGMEILYKGYKSYDDMINDVSQGTIDVAFPVGGGLYYSEESGIYQSMAVASASTDLVYKNEYNDDVVKHFAVNENNRMQYYYIITNFPDAEVSFYSSIEECLEAVLSGEVSATTLNGLRANDILRNSRYKGLYLKQLGVNDDRCFGVKIGNEGLLRLINHGINVLGTEYAQNIAYRYARDLYSYSLMDLIKDNIWLFLAIVLLVAIFVIVLIVRDLRRTRRADRLKSDFVSNMSHEIRTPITAILGMNELIKRESDDKEILKYSNNIEKAGESLLGIINDILDFSRIEAGRLELINKDYSLPDLLLGLCAMIEIKANEKGLEFEMEVDEELPKLLKGDSQKLGQIITNLLTNAVKYTENGGVKCEVKPVSADDNHIIMKVIVKDTGIGIKDDEKDKLYSAFERLDLERTGNIEGSGLGLAICERMLELMDSKIKLESEYGKGSSFYFEVRQEIVDKTPIGDFEAYRIAGAYEKDKRKGVSFTAPSARILIVDDTPVNLQVVSGLLKQYKLLTDTAGSGKMCIEKLGVSDYDIVFLDHRMPEMGGIETINELIRLYPDKMKTTAVVSLTANALSGVKEEMIKAGFSDYLTKPVNVSEMEEVLLKYLPKEKIIMGAPQNDDLETAYDEKEEAVLEKLRDIELLDVSKGIEYCGDAEDYLDALEIYRESVSEKSDELIKKLSEADYESFSLLAHSLKSSSRAVGATGLSDMAKELEALAESKDEKQIDEKTKVFVEFYRSLGRELDDILDI